MSLYLGDRVRVLPPKGSVEPSDSLGDVGVVTEVPKSPSEHYCVRLRTAGSQSGEDHIAKLKFDRLYRLSPDLRGTDAEGGDSAAASSDASAVALRAPKGASKLGRRQRSNSQASSGSRGSRSRRASVDRTSRHAREEAPPGGGRGAGSAGAARGAPGGSGSAQAAASGAVKSGTAGLGKAGSGGKAAKAGSGRGSGDDGGDDDDEDEDTTPEQRKARQQIGSLVKVTKGDRQGQVGFIEKAHPGDDGRWLVFTVRLGGERVRLHKRVFRHTSKHGDLQAALDASAAAGSVDGPSIQSPSSGAAHSPKHARQGGIMNGRNVADSGGALSAASSSSSSAAAESAPQPSAGASAPAERMSTSSGSSGRPQPVEDPSNPAMSAAEAEAASLRLAAELQAMERRTSGRRRRTAHRSGDGMSGSLAGSTDAGDARSVSTAGTRIDAADRASVLGAQPADDRSVAAAAGGAATLPRGPESSSGGTSRAEAPHAKPSKPKAPDSAAKSKVRSGDGAAPKLSAAASQKSARVKDRKRALTGDQWIGQQVAVVSTGQEGRVTGSGHGFFHVEFADGTARKFRKAQLSVVGDIEAAASKPPHASKAKQASQQSSKASKSKQTEPSGKNRSKGSRAASSSSSATDALAGSDTAAGEAPPAHSGKGLTSSGRNTPKRRESLEGAEMVAKMALKSAGDSKAGGAGSRLRSRLAALGEGVQQELSRKSRAGSLTDAGQNSHSEAPSNAAGGTSDNDDNDGDGDGNEDYYRDTADVAIAAPPVPDRPAAASRSKSKKGKHGSSKRRKGGKGGTSSKQSANPPQGLRSEAEAQAQSSAVEPSSNRPNLRIQADGWQSEDSSAAEASGSSATDTPAAAKTPKTPLATDAARGGRKRPRRAAAVSASQALAGQTPMADENGEDEEYLPLATGARGALKQPSAAVRQSSGYGSIGGQQAQRSLMQKMGGQGAARAVSAGSRVARQPSVTIQPIATTFDAPSASSGRQSAYRSASQRSRSDAAPLPPTTPATVYANSDDETSYGRDAEASSQSSRKRRRMERERRAMARATDQGVARVNKMLAHQERIRQAVQRAKDWYAKEGRPNIGHFKRRLDLPSLDELYVDFEDWKLEAGEAVAAAREVVAEQVAALEAEGVAIGLRELSSDDISYQHGSSNPDDPLADPVSLVRVASLMEPQDALDVGTPTPKTPSKAAVGGVQRKHKAYGGALKGPLPPIVPELASSSSQRSASGVSAVLSRLGAHYKEVWLQRRSTIIHSAVAAAEAAALSACLSMRSTGYYPGEYAISCAQYEAVKPALKAAETAARAVLLGQGAVDMLYGPEAARSLMSLPREVAVDGYAYSHGRKSDPASRGYGAMEGMAGPDGIASLLQTAVAPSVLTHTLRGCGWTPRFADDDEAAQAAEAVGGQEPTDREIAKVAKQARAMDVYGARSASAIHSEVLRTRLQRYNDTVVGSAVAPLLEEPSAKGSDNDEGGDGDGEDDDPVEPTATIQPVALAIDLASGEGRPRDPFATDPITATGAPQFASLTEALLAADTANAVNRPTKPVMHWRLGSHRLDRAIALARGIPLAEEDASSDEEDSDEEVHDPRENPLHALGDSSNGSSTTSPGGAKVPASTLSAKHFGAAASRHSDRSSHGLKDVPWHVWQRHARGKKGYGAVSRWDETWQYKQGERPALEPGSEPWVFGARPLGTAGEYLALAAAQERAALHQGRKRLRAYHGGLPSAGGMLPAADAEELSPLQAEADAVAHLDDGELDRQAPERGTAPALTPAAAGPLGSDPFGVHGADAFGGAAKSRERDWNTLPTMGAPSLAGAQCAACGFQKETETDHCWNEDCPLCPLSSNRGEAAAATAQTTSGPEAVAGAKSQVGSAGLRAFAAAVAAAEAWEPVEPSSAPPKKTKGRRRGSSASDNGMSSGRSTRNSEQGRANAARQAAAHVLAQIGAAGAGKAAADMLVSMGPQAGSKNATRQNEGWTYGVVGGYAVDAGLHTESGGAVATSTSGTDASAEPTGGSSLPGDRGAAADASRMDTSWAYALVQAASGLEVRHASLAALAAATARVLSSELTHGTAAEAGITACTTRQPGAATESKESEPEAGKSDHKSCAASTPAASRCAGLLASLGLKGHQAAALATRLGSSVSQGMGAAIALEALLDSRTACELAGVTCGDARAWWVREQERPDLELDLKASVHGGAAWARTAGGAWRAKLPAGESAALAALTVPRRRLRGQPMLEGWRPVVSDAALKQLDKEEEDAVRGRHGRISAGATDAPPAAGTKRSREQRDAEAQQASEDRVAGILGDLPSVARTHRRGTVRPRLMQHAEWVAVDEACRDVFAREYDYAATHNGGCPAPPLLHSTRDGIVDELWERRRGALAEGPAGASQPFGTAGQSASAKASSGGSAPLSSSWEHVSLGLPETSVPHRGDAVDELKASDGGLASAPPSGVVIPVANSREASLLIWEGGASLSAERKDGSAVRAPAGSTTMRKADRHEDAGVAVADDLRRDPLAMRPGPVTVLPSFHEVRRQVFRRAVTALRITRLQHGWAVQQCLTEGQPLPSCPYRTVEPEHIRFREWAELAVRRAAKAGSIPAGTVRDAVAKAAGSVALPWSTSSYSNDSGTARGRGAATDGSFERVLESFRAWMVIGPPPESDDEDGLPEPVWNDGAGEDLPSRPDCEVYARHAPPPDLSYIRAAIWGLPLPVHSLLTLPQSQGGFGWKAPAAATATGLGSGSSARRSPSPTIGEDDMAAKALVGVMSDRTMARRRTQGWSNSSVHPLAGFANVMLGDAGDSGSASSSSTADGQPSSVFDKQEAAGDLLSPRAAFVAMKQASAPAHDADFGDLLAPLLEMRLPLAAPALPGHMHFFLRPTEAQLTAFSSSNKGIRKLLQRLPPPFSGASALASASAPEAAAFHGPPGRYRPGTKARPLQGLVPQPPAHAALAAGHDPAGGPMTVLSVPRGTVKSSRAAQHGGPRGIPPTAHAAAAASLVLASEAAAAAERAGLTLTKDDDSLSMLPDNPRYVAAAQAGHVGGGPAVTPQQSSQLLRAARQQAEQLHEEYQITMIPTLQDGSSNPHYDPSRRLPRPRQPLEVLEEEAAKAVTNDFSGVPRGHQRSHQRENQTWTGGRLEPDASSDPLGGGLSVLHVAAGETPGPDGGTQDSDGSSTDGANPKNGHGSDTRVALLHARLLEAQNADRQEVGSDRQTSSNSSASRLPASSSSSASSANASAKAASHPVASALAPQYDAIMSWGRGYPERAHFNLLGAGLTRVYAPEASRNGFEVSKVLQDTDADGSVGSPRLNGRSNSDTRSYSSSASGPSDLAAESARRLRGMQDAARLPGNGAGTGANSAVSRLAIDAPVHVLGSQRAPRDPWHPSAAGRTTVPFVLPFKPELPAALQELPAMPALLKDDSNVDPSIMLSYARTKYGSSGAELRALHKRITERAGRRHGRRQARSPEYFDAEQRQDETLSGGAPGHPTASLTTPAAAGAVAGSGVGVDAAGGLSGASLSARGTGEGPVSSDGHGTGEGWLGRHVRSWASEIDAVNRHGIEIALSASEESTKGGGGSGAAASSSASASVSSSSARGREQLVAGLDLPHPDEAAAALLLATSRKELSLEEATVSRQGALDLLAEGHARGLKKFLKECRKRRRASMLSEAEDVEGSAAFKKSGSGAGGDKGEGPPSKKARSSSEKSGYTNRNSSQIPERDAGIPSEVGNGVDGGGRLASEGKAQVTGGVEEDDTPEDKGFEEMSNNAARGAPPGWITTADDHGEAKHYFFPGDGTRVCTLSEGPHAFVLRMPAIQDPEVEEGPPYDHDVDAGVARASAEAYARFLRERYVPQDGTMGSAASAMSYGFQTGALQPGQGNEQMHRFG